MYAMKKRGNIPKNDCWHPGDLLTEEDAKLLKTLIDVANQLGYSPKKSQVKNADALKCRFRTWENCLLAANLPSLKDKEQEALRNQANEKDNERKT